MSSALQQHRAMATQPHDGTPYTTTVSLRPIAAPSILGLFGFSGATLIVAAHMAGWYGGSKTDLYVFPFAAFFGGLAQFAAGMWSYRARDGLATAMHGMWGSFWMAFGVLNLLFATGSLTEPKGAFPALGFWFIPLAAITWSGALAALGESLGLFAVLATLATGSTIAAPALWTGSAGWEKVAGWVFVFSAGFAWYVATAMMLAATAGKTILPLGKYKRAANVPGERPVHPIQLEWAEPGVKMGQ
ncbi:MAG TPA: GPR1/FUN34/YaaH family transporter [Gaiellaceae bacterium]|nr:GPR1/FUN34/YaaH family transporter [Gaiellaceae bacterium]